jgi:hypothetical protein
MGSCENCEVVAEMEDAIEESGLEQSERGRARSEREREQCENGEGRAEDVRACGD